MSSEIKPVCAIIGHRGMVGAPIYRYFKENGYPVMGLSLKSKTHTWEEINSEAKYI